MPSLINRTGQRYGRLLVVGRDESMGPASNGRRVYWRCVCDCGETKVATGHELAAGATSSCGCLARELLGNRARRHGKTLTPTHQSWRGAKERCCNPSHDRYASYGGRGIQMCAEWRDSFEAFLRDMGERPPQTSLDRIDNDGNYEPGNCRWATTGEQIRNRRKSLQWGGARTTLKEVAKNLGLPRTSLNKAYKRLGNLDLAIAYTREHMKS